MVHACAMFPFPAEGTDAVVVGLKTSAAFTTEPSSRHLFAYLEKSAVTHACTCVSVWDISLVSHDAFNHDVTQELLLGGQQYYCSKSYLCFRSEYKSATMMLAGFFPSSNNVCSESKLNVPPLELVSFSFKITFLRQLHDRSTVFFCQIL